MIKNNFIYFITNGYRYYIGITNDLTDRWSTHKRDLQNRTHHSIKLQRYYDKYGSSDLQFGILMANLYKTDGLSYEKFLIKCFDAYRRGFNCTEGGENPPIKTRNYYFKNMRTGQEFRGDNLTKFAKSQGIISIPQLSAILNGKVKYYYDWYCPDKWTPPIYSLMDSSGKIHTFHKIGEFAKLHKLDCTKIYLLTINKLRNVNGWTNPTKPKRRANNEKTFSLIKDNKEVIIATNIKEFSKQYNLNKSTISRLLNGHIDIYNGWKLYNKI